MTNVPMEVGPYSNLYIPVGAGLQPHQFGYATGPFNNEVGLALSTGRAVAGIAATAMGALHMLTNGTQPQIVVNDLMRPIR